MNMEYGICDCRHFSTPTYNRDILTREDHLNLLATPRGYRWYGPDGESQIRKRAFLGKKRKEAPQPFPGFRQFMVEIWSILTPDLILSLKEILEEEFGMTAEQAVQFMIVQKQKAERLAQVEAMGPCKMNDDDLCWARTMARAIASKMTQYTEMMTMAKKNPRTALLHKHLLQNLQKAFGVLPEGEGTPLKKLAAGLANGLSVWLSTIPGERSIDHICSDLMSLYSSVSLK